MSLTHHAENALLDHLLGVAFAAPTLHVALGHGSPDDSGAGLQEPADPAYARVLCGHWSAAVGRSAAIATATVFAAAQADWGTITHFALFDAVAGGHMLAFGPLDEPRTVRSGDVVQVPAAALVLSFAPGAFGDELARRLLDHLLGVASYTPPALYLALSSAAPGDDGAGLSEPVGGYARQSCGSWSAADAGQVSHLDPIVLPMATQDWPTLTHVALMNSGSGGQVLVHAPLAGALAVLAGDVVRFEPGTLTVALD